MKCWFLLHNIIFATKRSKVEPEHPNLRSVRILEDSLECSSTNFDCLWQKEFYEEKNNEKLVSLHKIILQKTAKSSARASKFGVGQDALGCSGMI